MSLDVVREPLRDLTLQALTAISQSSIGIDGCRPAIAYFDLSKDALITSRETFASAVEALANSQPVQASYGPAEAGRLAIQFVYTACSHVADESSYPEAYERAWASFAEEMRKVTWSFKAVANMQNIESSQHSLTLGPGVSVRGRSHVELAALMDWGTFEIGELSLDWRAGAKSSFVLLVEREVAKTPSNFLLVNDGSESSITSRTLLAMRLAAPGDVRIGRLFTARPAAFNVGLGGLTSSGFTYWHPGPTYKLTPSLVPQIEKTCQSLITLEQQPGKASRTLRLALRSFSSIYDRMSHQAEDRVVDAITALEALWRLDAELSFRLAFRTASVLALSDDERVSILDTLIDYYRIRSKVVHGGSLTDAEEQQLREDEPLRSIVRRTLRAFLHLAINPGDWTLERLIKEADRTLVHAGERGRLQAAMDIGHDV